MSPEAVPALALAALWVIAAFAPRAGRRALLDGLRCMSRYPDLWRIPALFGLGYACFQIAAAALFHGRLQEEFPLVARHPASSWSVLAAGAWRPALEHTAAVFTIFTATFPLSAIIALLFVLNFGGLLAELNGALRQRLGGAAGALLTAALLAGALAAIAKPAVYLLLPEIAERVPVSALLAITLLSSAFELLLGIFFLTYLMLMTHAWRRGLHFGRPNLRLLAMRRTGFVIRWSLLLAAVAVILVGAPAYLGLLVDPADPLAAACGWFSTEIGRPILVVATLLFFPVQAVLVFHNESLGPALGEAGKFLRSRAVALSLFLVAAYGPFLALEILAGQAGRRLGEETLAGLGMRVGVSLVEAWLAGWLIASWVCLYKSLSAGRKEIPF